MLERVGGRLTSSPADITLGLRTEGDCCTPAGVGDLEAVSATDWALDPSASGGGGDFTDPPLLFLGWLGGRKSTAALDARLGTFSMITHEELLSAVLGLEPA